MLVCLLSPKYQTSWSLAHRLLSQLMQISKIPSQGYQLKQGRYFVLPCPSLKQASLAARRRFHHGQRTGWRKHLWYFPIPEKRLLQPTFVQASKSYSQRLVCAATGSIVLQRMKTLRDTSLLQVLNLRMRILLLSMTSLGSFLWPMLERIQMAPRSSYDWCLKWFLSYFSCSCRAQLWVVNALSKAEDIYTSCFIAPY